jgi:peptidoglycan hydrolase-like protein with peptidoglycan-binding domain
MLPSLYVGVHRKSEEHADLVGDLQKFFLGRKMPILVDEKFGQETKNIVARYQAANGLGVDGSVGPQTWGRLLQDGFRPKAWQPDGGGIEDERNNPNFPAKPPGVSSPNGLLLFGQGFEYQPKPLPTMPEYVDPDDAWVAKHIGMAYVPQLTDIKGSPEVLFNERLIPQLEAVFSVWDSLGLISLIKTWDGSFVTRFIRGRNDKLSNHSFGSAMDINAKWNPFRTEPALVSEEGTVRPLVQAAFQLGFFWGGWYNDGMHFEAYKVLTREQIEVAVNRILGGAHG